MARNLQQLLKESTSYADSYYHLTFSRSHFEECYVSLFSLNLSHMHMYAFWRICSRLQIYCIQKRLLTDMWQEKVITKYWNMNFLYQVSLCCNKVQKVLRPHSTSTEKVSFPKVVDPFSLVEQEVESIQQQVKKVSLLSLWRHVKYYFVCF